MRKFLSMLMLVMTLIIALPVTTEASSTDPLQSLIINVCTGVEATTETGGTGHDYKTSGKYKMKEGGYLGWIELVDSTKASDYRGFIKKAQYDKLTPKAQQQFVTDIFSICESFANATANKDGSNKNETDITDDTVDDFLKILGDETGMGATLLAALMEKTKPNYAAANRIYEPFSGIVGTILGLISVLIMALLGVTMALDIAYITIPAFYNFCDEGGGTGGVGGGKGKNNMLANFISDEAKNAHKAANGGGGAHGQGGGDEKSLAIGIYFKSRWIGLVVLGICLLYLVQGQIYTFVAWFINLLSGFLQF